ncbi:hypothetical protein J6590_081732 [Homalodisca vitripennis]|nr:hypothetical protein J6590_081732 [Homalodisca vitripennis]
MAVISATKADSSDRLMDYFNKPMIPDVLLSRYIYRPRGLQAGRTDASRCRKRFISLPVNIDRMPAPHGYSSEVIHGYTYTSVAELHRSSPPTVPAACVYMATLHARTPPRTVNFYVLIERTLP